MVRLTPLRLLSAAALLCLVYYLASTSTFGGYAYTERGYDLLPALTSTDNTIRFGQECSPFASGALRNVTFVLRLSPAAATPTALPAILDRLGRCNQDVLAFSPRKHAATNTRDLDILDPLAHLRPEYRWNNTDFDVYDRLHAANASDTDTDTDTDHDHDAWKLDKYTALPMMEWAAYLRPDTRWFVFLEADTYLNYDNLHRFLARFDPATAHYLGAPVFARKKATYADSAAAFILSRGALNKLMSRGRMFAENHHFPGTHFFGEDVSAAASGSAVLASVLKKSGVPLRGYAPSFSSSSPHTLRFSPALWCNAVLTLHAPNASALAVFDTTRPSPAQPLTFSHLFALIEPALRQNALDWSNLSDDTTTTATSPAACENKCERDARCMQWEHTGDVCSLSHSIRLGGPKPPVVDMGAETTRRWASGWMLARVAAFKGARGVCEGARVGYPSP